MASGESVLVTIPLPRQVYDEAARAAERTHRPVEEQLAALVESGLQSDADPDQIMAEARTAYLEHMAALGRGPLTTKETWEQLRRVRREVAHELYPPR